MDRNDADHAAVSDWIDEQDEEHATLDERHFRVLEPLTGESAFTLLPADA